MNIYVICLKREDNEPYKRFVKIKRKCTSFTEAYAEAYRKVEELLNEKKIYYEVIEISKQ